MKLNIWILLTIALIWPHISHAAQPPRVAIIGGGGGGLTTAWLLDMDCEVTLFEKENRLGGHADTLEIIVEDKTVVVDAGAEFFSERMYPYFTNLLKILEVPTRQFPLVYTFYWTDGRDTTVMPPIQDERVFLISLWPLSKVFDLIQFSHVIDYAKELVKKKDTSITLKEFVDSLSLTDEFKEQFFFPFLAAGWGFTLKDFKKFAAYGVLKYAVLNQPIGLSPMYWIEIIGGTSQYIKKAASQLRNTTVKLTAEITNITYDGQFYLIEEADGTISYFDDLVLATNAFQAKDLLKNVVHAEEVCSILGEFEYKQATIAIHGDRRFMPPNEEHWSVANIRYNGEHSAMTFYKFWRDSPSPIFRSWITFDVRDLEVGGGPMPDPLYAIVQYWHPHINLKYFQAQKAIQSMNGHHHLWFAGLYTEDADAHESAIVSAIRIAKELACQSTRLKALTNLE